MRSPIAAIAAGCLASCSTFGSAPDEGTTDGAVGVDAPIGNDAGDSAIAEGGSSCTTLINDDFKTVASDWLLIGDDEEIKGELILTPGGEGKQGAAWWGKPLAFTGSGSLRVQVAFSVTNKTGGPVGNGFGIGWTTTLPTEIGGLGQSFGICSTAPALTGYLFGASTTSSEISILDTTACNTSPGGTRTPATLDGDHTVLLVIRSTAIRATLDKDMGSPVVVTRDSLDPPAAATGYLGFAASAVTMTGASRHTIKSVRVESCAD